MYCAIYKAPIQVWKLLISFGANVNIKSTYDQNILHEYLDNNDKKYLELLNQPWFNEYNIPENNKLENIKSFLYKIFK